MAEGEEGGEGGEKREFQAVLDVRVKCPKCDAVMRFADAETIECGVVDCDLYHMKFDLPKLQVALKEK